MYIEETVNTIFSEFKFKSFNSIWIYNYSLTVLFHFRWTSNYNSLYQWNTIKYVNGKCANSCSLVEDPVNYSSCFIGIIPIIIIQGMQSVLAFQCSTGFDQYNSPAHLILDS